MATPREQTYIPGTEPPVDPAKDPPTEEALYAWLNAKLDQRDAAERTRIRHATLITRMLELGLERYPYVDPTTGKKRQVIAKRELKAKTGPAPKKSRRDEKPDDVGVEVMAKPPPREHSDPFGSTRRALDDKQRSVLDIARERQAQEAKP